VSPLGRVNYLSYFLPPGTELGECLLVPGALERTEGRLFAVCSPTIRAAACEAFVRACFAQHLAYSEYSKLVDADILKKAQKAEAQAQTQSASIHPLPAQVSVAHNNVPLAETSFLPMAVFAVLAVLLHESNRNTRREACVSLRAAAMDLPPRQLLQALSCDEPMRCMGWADPQGCSGPPAHRFQKQHRQALRSMDGAMGRLALRQLWASIIDSGEDQCVRAELLQTWLYLFHQCDGAICVPPALAAGAAALQDGDIMVTALGLDADVLEVGNPLDAYSRAQASLFGNQWRNLHSDTARQSSVPDEHDRHREGHKHKNKPKDQHHHQRHFAKKKPIQQQQQQQHRQLKPAEQSVVGSRGDSRLSAAASSSSASQTLRLSLSTSSLNEKTPTNGEPKLSIKRKISLIIR